MTQRAQGPRRRSDPAPAYSVSVLSAARDLEAAADRIGADAWIAKPFRLLEEIEAVERLVQDRAA